MENLLSWFLALPQTPKQRAMCRETLRSKNPDLKGKEILALAIYQTGLDGPKNIAKRLSVSDGCVRIMIRDLGLQQKEHASTRKKAFGLKAASQLERRWNTILSSARAPWIKPKPKSQMERYYANHEKSKQKGRDAFNRRYAKLKCDPTWRAKMNAKQKRYRQANPGLKLTYDRKWRLRHPETWRAAVRRNNRKLRKLPQYRVKDSLRRRLRDLIKYGRLYNGARSHALIGCTTRKLVEYLESLFLPGMNWENYGDWHVDHKRPIASFDLGDEHQARACFHYTNLQPMWADANHAKGSVYNGVKWRCGQPIRAA
ncbi:MAG: hypothetical protein JSR30_00155 [Proteobacteria bacterium]|nr:hypothetical protein [Pseudomonadota bacterium]